LKPVSVSLIQSIFIVIFESEIDWFIHVLFLFDQLLLAVPMLIELQCMLWELWFFVRIDPVCFLAGYRKR